MGRADRDGQCSGAPLGHGFRCRLETRDRRRGRTHIHRRTHRPVVQRRGDLHIPHRHRRHRDDQTGLIRGKGHAAWNGRHSAIAAGQGQGPRRRRRRGDRGRHGARGSDGQVQRIGGQCRGCRQDLGPIDRDRDKRARLTREGDRELIGAGSERDRAIDDRHSLAEVCGAGDLDIVDGDPGRGNPVLAAALAVDHMQEERGPDGRRHGNRVGEGRRGPVRAHILCRAEEHVVGGGKGRSDECEPHEDGAEDPQPVSFEQYPGSLIHPIDTERRQAPSRCIHVCLSSVLKEMLL